MGEGRCRLAHFFRGRQRIQFYGRNHSFAGEHGMMRKVTMDECCTFKRADSIVPQLARENSSGIDRPRTFVSTSQRQQLMDQSSYKGLTAAVISV